MARRYVLLPGNKDITPGDLQFQEFAKYIQWALGKCGFESAESVENADTVIVATYSIGEPQQRSYTYSIPHWGPTGYHSAQTFGTISNIGNVRRYSGTTYLQPSYGITGYSTGVGTYTTYMRVLGLIAFDARSGHSRGEPKEIWRLVAASKGKSDDLRAIFPYLVAAARPYLGKATDGKAVDFEFLEDDERIVDTRRALADDSGGDP